MSALSHDTALMDASAPSRRWAVPPPLLLGRAHAAAEKYARHEIRWIWSEICEGTGLMRRIPPFPGRLEPPRIGRVTLGPPTSFTVELRPGMFARDLVDIAPRVAAAYGVAAVGVEPLVRGWVTVDLIEDLVPDDDAAVYTRSIPAPTVPLEQIPVGPPETVEVVEPVTDADRSVATVDTPVVIDPSLDRHTFVALIAFFRRPSLATLVDLIRRSGRYRRHARTGPRS